MPILNRGRPGVPLAAAAAHQHHAGEDVGRQLRSMGISIASPLLAHRAQAVAEHAVALQGDQRQGAWRSWAWGTRRAISPGR